MSNIVQGSYSCPICILEVSKYKVERVWCSEEHLVTWGGQGGECMFSDILTPVVVTAASDRHLASSLPTIQFVNYCM